MLLEFGWLMGGKGIKGGEILKPKIKLLLIFRIEGKSNPGIVKSFPSTPEFKSSPPGKKHQGG